MPRTERLASSTVTSCDLQKQHQPPQQEHEAPAPRSPAAASSPPAERSPADAAASSTHPGRGEALAEEQCDASRLDGSTENQNTATSLDAAVFQECPSSDEGQLKEETKEEEEGEDEEEIMRVEGGEDLAGPETTPIKDTLEVEDGECERGEGGGGEEEEEDDVDEDDDEIQGDEDNHEENIEDVNDENEEENNEETEVNTTEDLNRPDSETVREHDSDPPEVLEEQQVQKDEEDSAAEKLGNIDCELSEEQEPQESLEMDTSEEKCEARDSEQSDVAEETAAEEGETGETADDDEALAPTDLSLPKVENQDDDIPLNCTKNIPRNISTVIPPVVPSPQPRPSPTYPPATPAHQTKAQHSSKFLESLLSSPRKCHEVPRRSSSETDKGPAPLDLGVTSANRGAGSPTVSCSDETRKTSRPAKEPAEGEPKAKVMKVEDITLKNLLSRQPDASSQPSELDLSSVSKKDDVVESGRKSRLLELLTSEPSSASVSPSPIVDPLMQLKKVLSDPEITVPDPLLVPRDRLQELVANPAREIPRLLTMRPELRLPEALAYPTLLRDPDLLVVSLSHLQSLLQKSEKSVKEDDAANYSNLGSFLEWHRYQNQHQAAVTKELLDAQMKHQQQQHHHQQQQQQQQPQSQQDLDAAAAAALNQMLWLPYLTQLEAAAMACGNNQEFLNLLNAVFPASYAQPGQTPPPPPYPFLAAMNPSIFNVPPNDYKSQVEFHNAIMVWHEMMMQANAANSLNNNNTTTSNNNHRSPKVPSNNSANKNFSSNTNGRYPAQSSRKYNSTSSARTSPLTPNSFHSPPPPPSPQHRATPSALLTASPYLPGSGAYPTTSQLHHQYNLQRCRSNGTASVPAPKQQKNADSLADTKSNSGRSSANNKALFNLLSGPALQDVAQPQHLPPQPLVSPPSTTSRQQHSHLLAALGKPSGTSTPAPPSPTMPPLVPLPPSPLDLSGATKKAPTPKLKVKDHLVDPSHTPKLLKADPSPEVGSTTSHPHLWHPLFGSQKTSLNSPWSWTTVTVNGE